MQHTGWHVACQVKLALVCWHPICGLICASAAPLVTQVSASALGKAAEDGPSAWGSDIHLGDLEDAPGSRLQPGHGGYLGDEPALGRCLLSSSPFVSETLSFKINK